MLVRALEACFVDGHRRRKGAEFEFAGELPAHLVPASTAAPEAPAAVVPVSLSQMAMAENKPRSFVETVGKKKTGPEKV